LFTLARNLESAADRNDPAACDSSLSLLSSEHRAVCAILNDYAEATESARECSAPPSGDIAAADLVPVLAGLVHRLECASPHARKYLPLLAEGWLGADSGQHLGQVVLCVKGFDFDGALTALNAYASQRGLGMDGVVQPGGEAQLRKAEKALEAGDIRGAVHILKTGQSGQGSA
jgi:hypothetical protein